MQGRVGLLNSWLGRVVFLLAFVAAGLLSQAVPYANATVGDLDGNSFRAAALTSISDVRLGLSTVAASASARDVRTAAMPLAEAARSSATPAGVAAEEGGALASAARTCSVNSFTGATLVTMADGSRKPIRDVKLGDKVLATDPETGETAARPVTKLIVHSGKHTMVDVHLADGSSITATDRHPFWDATTGEFSYAIDLRPGHQVRQINGQLLAVAAIHVYDQDLTVYNLTVDDIHTYYAGATPVLVHNSCVDDAAGIEHSLATHMAGGAENTVAKFLWEAGTDASALSRLADATEGTVGMFSRAHGTVQYTLDAGRIVGTSRGMPTTWYTVARDPFDAGLVTMFPGI